MLGDKSLAWYYRITFGLMQHHKYSLGEIEMMIPFEMEIYIDMLFNHLEEQQQKTEQQ